MAKKKLVKFDNGLWGVAIEGWFTTRFIDLKASRCTWGMKDSFFFDCQGTEEEAKKVFQKVSVKGYTEVEYTR